MAAATTTVAEPATVTLDLLDPGLFPDRDSIRKFLTPAGGAGWITHMIKAALFPNPEEDDTRVPAQWLKDARWAAWYLLDDLVALARAGASEIDAVTAEASERTVSESEREDYRRSLAAILPFSEASVELSAVSLYLGGADKPAAEAAPETPEADEAAERSTVALHLVNPNRFPSREAVREFVASEAFGRLGSALSVCLCPDTSVKPDSLVSRAGRDAASFLVEDLVALARDAVQPDSVPFAVCEDEGVAPARGRNLAAIAALVEASDAIDPIFEAVLDLVDGLCMWEPRDEAGSQA